MTEFSLTETNVLDMAFYGQESLYRDCIAQVMRDDGWLVKTEVRTNLGIADLVARRDKEIWVIEAKLFGDNNSVAHACGQLLFYTDELRFTKRLIAVPERLLFKFDSVLSFHGIDLFWFTPYSRPVNDLFKKQQQIKAVEAFMQEALVQQQVVAKLREREKELADLDRKSKDAESRLQSLNKQIDSYSSIERMTRLQRDQIEKCRSMLAELAANMEGFDRLENDPKTDQLWDALADMLRNGALAIEFFRGTPAPLALVKKAA